MSINKRPCQRRVSPPLLLTCVELREEFVTSPFFRFPIDVIKNVHSPLFLSQSDLPACFLSP